MNFDAAVNLGETSPNPQVYYGRRPQEDPAHVLMLMNEQRLGEDTGAIANTASLGDETKNDKE